MHPLRLPLLAAALLCCTHAVSASEDDADVLATWNCLVDHNYTIQATPDGKYQPSASQLESHMEIVLSNASSPPKQHFGSDPGSREEPSVDGCEWHQHDTFSVSVDGTTLRDCSLTRPPSSPDFTHLEASLSELGEMLKLVRDDADWRVVFSMTSLDTARSVRRDKTSPRYKPIPGWPEAYAHAQALMLTGECVMTLGPASK
jgi:hypothetical protein